MNYLAHIHLSGENDFVKIGNFMADSVRGHDYLDFPNEIKNGILLHRFIDSFTDFHPTYRKSKHRLHEKYGHYSGVIMDIFYDHFLAKNWSNYNNQPLEIYADHFYLLLEQNLDVLTEKTRSILPYMKTNNWLVKYATIGGLYTILFQMDHRTKNRANMHESITELKLHYTEFEEEFTAFYSELIKASKNKLNELEHLNS